MRIFYKYTLFLFALLRKNITFVSKYIYIYGKYKASH